MYKMNENGKEHNETTTFKMRIKKVNACQLNFLANDLRFGKLGLFINNL